MNRKALLFQLFAFAAASGLASASTPRPPNVLFIAIDDLNDWVGSFGGNPQARTPNLDRLAESGAVVFQRAMCPGPVCGPSRSALLSGFMPHRSGVYGNAQNMRGSPLVQSHATLPEYFSKNGYHTLSRGKIFHKHPADQGQWAFDLWDDTTGVFGVDHTHLSSRIQNLVDGKPGPALSGGEDYELLFCARPRQRQRLEKLSRRAQVKITRIGSCVAAQQGITVIDGSGEPLALRFRGHDHFKKQ